MALLLVVVGATRYATSEPCEAIQPAHERDNCFGQHLVGMSAADAASAAAVAEAIQDPLIRSASAVAWAKANRGELTPEAAEGVCRFAGKAAGKCRYLVQAGHLGSP